MSPHAAIFASSLTVAHQLNKCAPRRSVPLCLHVPSIVGLYTPHHSGKHIDRWIHGVACWTESTSFLLSRSQGSSFVAASHLSLVRNRRSWCLVHCSLAPLLASSQAAGSEMRCDSCTVMVVMDSLLSNTNYDEPYGVDDTPRFPHLRLELEHPIAGENVSGIDTDLLFYNTDVCKPLDSRARYYAVVSASLRPPGCYKVILGTLSILDPSVSLRRVPGNITSLLDRLFHGLHAGTGLPFGPIRAVRLVELSIDQRTGHGCLSLRRTY